MLVPDYGFNADSDSIDNLHVLCLVNRRDIFSLRSLNKENLSMLNDIYENGVKY